MRFSSLCVEHVRFDLARKCMEHGAEKQFSGVRSGTERDHISPRAKRNRHRRIAKKRKATLQSEAGAGRVAGVVTQQPKKWGRGVSAP